MIIKNIPGPVSPDLYKEAVKRYIRQCKGFTRSVYTAGNVTYPGISDLDLVIIAKKRAFCSVNIRFSPSLFRSFSAFLHHEPFVIPEDFLQVWNYAALSNMKVVEGEDLLSAKPDLFPEYIFATALETALSYWDFARSSENEDFILNAALTIPVYSSLRFTLKSLNSLGITCPEDYSSEIDILRENIWKGGGEEIVSRMHKRFLETLKDMTDRILQSSGVDVRSKENIVRFYSGKDGNKSGFNAELFRGRLEDIKRYHSILEKRGFPFGSLFRTAFHGKLRISIPAKIIRKLTFFSGSIRNV